MDGWESRRKRVPGHDWCVIELGKPGVIRGICADTAHFTGNFPPRFSLQACHSGASSAQAASLARLAAMRPTGGGIMGSKASAEQMEAAAAIGSEGWVDIVPQHALQPGGSLHL